MKKVLSLLAIFSLILVSCEGDPGPPGPAGPPGEDGINIVAQAFEATVNFEDPEYSVFVEIPESIEVLDTDVVLVYWLEDVVDGDDVWSLLPQVYYLDNGDQFQYNYNHTFYDVNIYLDSPVDVGSLNLGPEFTDNQTFRLVVVPADYALNSSVNINSYQAVKADLDLDDKNVVKAQVHK